MFFLMYKFSYFDPKGQENKSKKQKTWAGPARVSTKLNCQNKQNTKPAEHGSI